MDGGRVKFWNYSTEISDSVKSCQQMGQFFIFLFYFILFEGEDGEIFDNIVHQKKPKTQKNKKQYILEYE